MEQDSTGAKICVDVLSQAGRGRKNGRHNGIARLAVVYMANKACSGKGEQCRFPGQVLYNRANTGMSRANRYT